MNTIDYINDLVIPAALALLPDKMNTLEAKALMLTIGLQESRFVYRHQLTGPAGGFWQFEEAGVRGVVLHPSTKVLLSSVLETLGYQPVVSMLQDSLDDNDILAAAFARLLLWTHQNSLPLRSQPNKAWMYYISLWRPGNPRQATWDAFHQQAWILIQGPQ